MNGLFYLAYGVVMAALVAYGGSGVMWKEYRYSIPCLVAGLALYALLWFIA